MSQTRNPSRSDRSPFATSIAQNLQRSCFSQSPEKTGLAPSYLQATRPLTRQPSVARREVEPLWEQPGFPCLRVQWDLAAARFANLVPSYPCARATKS